MTRNVRGSLIASSLQTLRELGHYDRYLALLPTGYRDTVLFALASSWLPIEAAACALPGLRRAEAGGRAADRHRRSGGQAHHGYVPGDPAAQRAQPGCCPDALAALTQYHRVCERIIDGGTFMVIEVGPKDAIVQTRGLPLFEYRYFRTATLGMFRGGVGVFAKTCYARELPERSTRDSMAVSVRWV
jgi:hypothetical protein